MAVREAIPERPEAETDQRVSSFTKALFLGEIHEELVFPWPRPREEEQERIRDLNTRLRDYCADHYDPRRVEEERWIPDQILRDLGEIGVLGLYVDERYGGQGLSQTGYARVFETIGAIDATLAIVLGVHQSIGYKGIALFGTDEQRERWLPDLAAGRKLAAFALTEPEAGSDAYNVRSRAVEQPDGSWVLNGEKRYIGNGSRADLITTFARAEIGGKDRHIALILEKGMDGLEVGERFDTMGLRGNDLRRLYFRDVRVPAENVLGEPGEGFRVAMQILNNGRIGLGTGSVGATKRLLDMTIDHVKERRQFGRPLADFELVHDKVGWMVSYLFGLEAMNYLTCGLVDAGVPDYSLESAICKVSGTEFLWYAANRSLQLAGGQGYLRSEPWEKIVRDIRIFPIFEGANDVLRAFTALGGIKPVGEKLEGLTGLGLDDPIGSIGVLVEYVADRARREVRPDRVTMAHEELSSHADAVSDQVKRLAGVTEKLLRDHGTEVVDRQFQQKRLADAVADIYAQISVLSRATAIFAEQGVEPSGQERYIADTFCSRAAARVDSNLDQMESNDDERMTAIAKLAYKRGEYGYALFED
ncbi:MAG TPA: acyl-CoA dehydrogenase family protein [Solirubrobacterales bacterium]|nr:acyl-CoA dehydrogenase family protein [Solirubrobacterales bacterium]